MPARQAKSFNFIYDKPIVFIQFDSIPGTFPMLIDTGADYTYLPLEWLEQLGHSNKNIPNSYMGGIGARNKIFSHTSVLKFLDDESEIVWKTGKIPVYFCEGLHNFRHGLVERDIICNMWEHYEQDTQSLDSGKWRFSFIPKKLYTNN